MGAGRRARMLFKDEACMRGRGVGRWRYMEHTTTKIVSLQSRRRDAAPTRAAVTGSAAPHWMVGLPAWPVKGLPHLVSCAAGDGSAVERQAHAMRICSNELVPHCLIHVAVQVVGFVLRRQQVGQRHNLQSRNETRSVGRGIRVKASII